MIAYFNIHFLSINLSKAVLSSGFVYLIGSFYYINFVLHELKKASINKNYSKGQLFKSFLYKIVATVELEGKQISGRLSNWDDEGFFIVLDDSSRLLGKKYWVSISFFGKTYRFKANKVFMASDKKGYGFGIVDEEKNLDMYQELSKIKREVGFETSLLK
jgi:hypothetical protein